MVEKGAIGREYEKIARTVGGRYTLHLLKYALSLMRCTGNFKKDMRNRGWETLGLQQIAVNMIKEPKAFTDCLLDAMYDVGTSIDRKMLNMGLDYCSERLPGGSASPTFSKDVLTAIYKGAVSSRDDGVASSIRDICIHLDEYLDLMGKARRVLERDESGVYGDKADKGAKGESKEQFVPVNNQLDEHTDLTGETLSSIGESSGTNTSEDEEFQWLMYDIENIVENLNNFPSYKKYLRFMYGDDVAENLTSEDLVNNIYKNPGVLESSILALLCMNSEWYTSHSLLLQTLPTDTFEKAEKAGISYSGQVLSWVLNLDNYIVDDTEYMKFISMCRAYYDVAGKIYESRKKYGLQVEDDTDNVKIRLLALARSVSDCSVVYDLVEESQSSKVLRLARMLYDNPYLLADLMVKMAMRFDVSKCWVSLYASEAYESLGDTPEMRLAVLASLCKNNKLTDEGVKDAGVIRSSCTATIRIIEDIIESRKKRGLRISKDLISIDDITRIQAYNELYDADKLYMLNKVEDKDEESEFISFEDEGTESEETSEKLDKQSEGIKHGVSVDDILAIKTMIKDGMLLIGKGESLIDEGKKMIEQAEKRMIIQ